MLERLKTIFARLRQYPLVTAAAAISIICLGLIFFRGSIQVELDEKLAQTESEWDRIEDNARRARNLEAQVEAIKAAVTNLEGRLLNPSEVAINYEYFFGLERKTNVRLTVAQGEETTSASIPGLPEMKNFRAINYTVSVEGRYSQLLAFLSELSNGRFFVRVSAINLMAPGREVQGPLTLNLQCQILGVKAS